MSPEFEELETFCAAEHATVLARECRTPSIETVLPCKHKLEGAPGSLDVKELNEIISESARSQLAVFYGRRASAKLFVVEDEAGIYLAPTLEWPLLFNEVHEWWSAAAADLEDDERSVLESAVVFGRIPASATFFLLASDDAFPGIYMFTGPGLEIARIADDFSDFLRRIPAEAFGWLRSDVRYCYEDRGLQFCPVEYRAGRNVA